MERRCGVGHVARFNCMTTITLYKPVGNQQFGKLRNVAIHGAVLTVRCGDRHWLFNSKRIRTTVPFLIDEDAEEDR
jgi:hypothetical protein